MVRINAFKVHDSGEASKILPDHVPTVTQANKLQMKTTENVPTVPQEDVDEMDPAGKLILFGAFAAPSPSVDDSYSKLNSWLTLTNFPPDKLCSQDNNEEYMLRAYNDHMSFEDFVYEYFSTSDNKLSNFNCESLKEEAVKVKFKDLKEQDKVCQFEKDHSPSKVRARHSHLQE